ncbi:uncharacterized protein LOC111263257 isoform X2 [Varroa jacobsoni]|uniref:uncharacterized protein LOC111263257 isoform X2 n=1 Tax=Varroa jacobsoni TaxID=62625 RepID=UPI000BF315A6|nr:uncharacterized protein LOC111263257 isoform X2 [Varroa jacobsoni]
MRSSTEQNCVTAGHELRSVQAAGTMINITMVSQVTLSAGRVKSMKKPGTVTGSIPTAVASVRCSVNGTMASQADSQRANLRDRLLSLTGHEEDTRLSVHPCSHNDAACNYVLR